MSSALAVVPVVLLLLGFPIYIVLLTAVSVALVFFMHVPLAALHQNLFGAIDAFALLAVPFFIYAGELMPRGSVAQRIVDFVQAGVGRVPGSLGVTCVGTSAIFGAISGASAATVATVGKAMLPPMRKAGYPETFSAGLITAVGAIDIIIPPSIPMIVYGTAAQESVPRLYAAGVLPALLIAAMIVVACASVFAWLLTVNQVPAAMVAWIESMKVSAWELLLAINLLLLLVGCFLDPLSAILLLTPLLIPLVKAVGIDTVHFGIVFTVNLAIGLFHPPFGINIFVAQSALKLKLDVIYRGIIPFIVLYLVALILITYVPWISLIGVKLFLGY